MSNFWPNGLVVTETQSPADILREAQNEWHMSSEGLMSLEIQTATSEAGNTILIVHAKHSPSKRSATLFSVVHRPDKPYPTSIEIQEEKLPNFLKKAYYQPGVREILGTVTLPNILTSEGKKVENNWVADTPLEFREKLKKAFNSSVITSEILNLLSSEARSETKMAAEIATSNAGN